MKSGSMKITVAVATLASALVAFQPAEAAKGLGSRSPSEVRINELGEGRSLYMTILSGG